MQLLIDEFMIRELLHCLYLHTCSPSCRGMRFAIGQPEQMQGSHASVVLQQHQPAM
jgi:hypothetical protein